MQHQIKNLLKKLKKDLPEYPVSSVLAQEFKEHIRDAQAYIGMTRELNGSEEQFTWNRLRDVYKCAEELIVREAQNFLKAVTVPVSDEPVAQLTWKENVTEHLKIFESSKILYVFILERLRILLDD